MNQKREQHLIFYTYSHRKKNTKMEGFFYFSSPLSHVEFPSILYLSNIPKGVSMNKEKNRLHVCFALLDLRHSQSPPSFTIPNKNIFRPWHREGSLYLV